MINQIFKEFGPNFCLRPYLGAFYVTSTADNKPSCVTPCCLVPQSKEFSVVNNSIIDTMNQPAWVKMRKDFAEGRFHEIPQCKICIDAEQNGVDSTRIGSTRHFVDNTKVDLISNVRDIIANDYRVDKIISLDYFPSNFCNYSCVMCNGGASSQRHTFEIKFNLVKDTNRMVVHNVTDDFFNILKSVENINFTGGETILQPQVHAVIDYLIDHDFAKNITIFILTNASHYPSDMEFKFSKFKRVIYMCSVDGIGAVGDYQRRGSNWPVVEKNVLTFLQNPSLSVVINYVLTAINAVQFMNFADWCYNNHAEFTSISPVFNATHLEVSAMPPGLRQLTLERLEHGRAKYDSDQSRIGKSVTKMINQVQATIEQNPWNPSKFNKFVQKIKIEDSASKISLVQAVPEWAPYFEVDQKMSHLL